MFSLRLVSVLTLIVWIGGAITIAGLVAPSAFAVLPSTEAAHVVGETLRRFHFVGYTAGVVLVGALVLAALIGPRPHAFWWDTCCVRVACRSCTCCSKTATWRYGAALRRR